MPRFYVEKDGEWNIFSTIIDNFVFDEFVCLDALKARLLYERYKELTEDIDSLLTDRPRVNVMPYSEAIERITDCETCRYAGKCDWEPWQECPYAPKDEPETEETEMERLERIDNEIEAAWAMIRELTDEPQTETSTNRRESQLTDCPWTAPDEPRTVPLYRMTEGVDDDL